MYMATVSCTEFYFTAAYLSVRTEPLSDIGQTGGKKRGQWPVMNFVNVWILSLIFHLNFKDLLERQWHSLSGQSGAPACSKACSYGSCMFGSVVR